MFRTILVANRGEIALRILRTVREMGLRGVAVFSSADAGAPHLRAADQAIALGEPEPARSYLDTGKLLAAARAGRADAIHPGYGFLSESAAFARAVREAGLAFIGPPPEAIERLGNKLAARRLLQAAGVPLVPGTLEPGGDPGRLREAAAALGYPVLVKAVAGGGGRGMRRVDGPEELEEAARRAASEARIAFGDGAVYLEKLLTRPRHVEVQILADAHGKVTALGERECSIQRRHQKLVEEAPCTALDDGLRARLAEAAVAVARAGGYQGAGTVEFLVAGGAFHFLEVNTRLQVEHPVTEAVTGLDLVRCQIEIAAGLPMAFAPAEVAVRGHAIECRICAEDPARGFLPAPGTITGVREPAGPGVRVDSGVAPGQEVTVWYDPLLAKVIVHAATREAAIARMDRALGELRIDGVATTRELLRDVVRSEPFAAARLHTGFLEEHFAAWSPPAAETPDPRAAEPGRAAGAAVGSPWRRLGAWDVAGTASPAPPAQPPDRSGIVTPGRRRAFPSAAAHLSGAPGSRPGGGPALPPGAVGAPMPAVVLSVAVAEGDPVEADAVLVVVSAMKTEIQLRAPWAGRVVAVRARAGQRVRPGEVMVQLAPEDAHGR